MKNVDWVELYHNTMVKCKLFLMLHGLLWKKCLGSILELESFEYPFAVFCSGNSETQPTHHLIWGLSMHLLTWCNIKPSLPHHHVEVVFYCTSFFFSFFRIIFDYAWELRLYVYLDVFSFSKKKKKLDVFIIVIINKQIKVLHALLVLGKL